MNIKETDEFKKDYKRLSKKYSSLGDDYKILIKSITALPNGDGSKHWNCILKHNEHAIYKVRMMCRSIKGKSLRVIYYLNEDTIEVECIEVYYKGKKSIEDKARLKKFWKQKVKLDD